ncbi:MAG: hypothetical protein ABI593_05440 [Betaproteobacteria bacterium]
MFYPRMDAYARTIATHVCDVAAHAGAAVAANCVGPCVQLFAGANSIPTLAALERVDKDATLRLTELLVRNGVSPLPRGLMYLSTAHDDEDIDLTLRALRVAIETFARESAGARR